MQGQLWQCSRPLILMQVLVHVFVDDHVHFSQRGINTFSHRILKQFVPKMGDSDQRWNHTNKIVPQLPQQVWPTLEQLDFSKL